MGTLLIIVGFIAAVAAGLWLALQVSQGSLRAGEALLSAGLLFIPVAVVVGAGMYLRVRRQRQAEPVSTVEKQRELVELLQQHQQMPVAEMAAALDIDEVALRGLVEQLVQLDVFTGEVDWDAGVIYAARSRNHMNSEY